MSLANIFIVKTDLIIQRIYSSLHTMNTTLNRREYSRVKNSALYICSYINNKRFNKKAVLSQRWPRDAHYISGWNEPAIAEIWPFEIIQDGGLPPTWIWCNRK